MNIQISELFEFLYFGSHFNVKRNSRLNSSFWVPVPTNIIYCKILKYANYIYSH
ncbi:hypothetical protein D1BOALGB6SA_645 [Olavius sp. associated proteobacterium Delta 1]|nr:hypothetical protein D1BOALGB6SA_645 [Olavius sp. associated proteobacterium Delta 1]